MRYVIKKRPEMDVDESLAMGLKNDLNISPVLAKLLCGRGIATLADATEFLYPQKTMLHDPYLFLDMKDSVSMVRNMISGGKKICVYGDYDADGVSACALLYKALKKLGADVFCFLPSRSDHGYGLSKASVESLAGTDLLITVDCGITNVEEIALAKKLGMKTIVTDHHECPLVLPKADCILNPKRPGEEYPYKHLCGAGVAFKFAHALLGEEAMEYIDLAAFATIADIVPLLGENRVIAKLGLEKMNRNPNLGIAVLFRKTGIRREQIDAQTVSFALAPRINAAGRMASANDALDLFVSDEESVLETKAENLCAYNVERQKRQEEIVEDALDMASGYPDDKMLVLYKKNWDVGIVGLAASKLAERFMRPTLLLGESGGAYVGSARSIEGVDVYGVLNTQAHLYEKFGGHAGAAGLTIKEEQLETLKNRLNAYMKETYAEEVFRPVKYYDIEIKPQDATLEFLKEMELLKPYGLKNEQPTMLIRHADIFQVKPIGADKHAKFLIGKYNEACLSAVVFSVRAEDVPKKADIIGAVNINDYDGKPQMIVETFSYDEPVYVRYNKAKRRLHEEKVFSAAEKKLFFCDRERIGALYKVLLAAADKQISFRDMEDLLRFMRRHTEENAPECLAFMTAVLEEIGLLELQKDDRIHIVVGREKRELENSMVYRRLMPDGKNDDTVK
ncbi:MAG: single-stranded-DNA-specific exonuclease RecJ [Christensenellaceae bacterium]|jgi:single-stranded-DNA-specific exonuclease